MRLPKVTCRRAKPPSDSTTYTNGRFSSSRKTAETGMSNPLLSCAAPDPDPDIHLLLEQIARIVDHHAHRHRSGVGVDQRRNVVHLSGEALRAFAARHLGGIAQLTDARSDPKICAMTQTRERLATVKHGVVPACQELPGSDQLLHHRSGDRRANRSAACAIGRPRWMPLMACSERSAKPVPVAPRPGPLRR